MWQPCFILIQQLAVLRYNLPYFVAIGSNTDLEVEVTFGVTL
jgi:hypothetical protein